MAKNISIGSAELEIMKVLWQAEEPVNTQYISGAVEEKGWKRTTISTFLTRLADKGAIASQRRGKLYYYWPLISQKEYRRGQTRELIRNLYNNSVKDLAVSLFQEAQLSQEDIRELRAIFDEAEE